MRFKRRFPATLLACASLLTHAACGGGGGAAESDLVKELASQTPAPAPSQPSSEKINQERGPRLDVPYVPTPEAVVARMLDTAKVNRNDVVYDLGSGDGRIVITAAKERGARGVGYDIDPERIAEANENARREGVARRVRFIEGDLFKADLSKATVVTLYLLPEINLKLRPKLLKELRPGVRVVSHNYGMGDWEHLSVEELEIDGRTHYIYFWIVPPRQEDAQTVVNRATPAR